MKRVLAIAAVLLAGVALVVFATGSGDENGGYRVRAIFDNAAFVIPGMDVRIGGVVVGSIASIDLTDDKKAAVVLQIDNPSYHDFRKDGFCTIRPQSLIGERFIECEPTQPKPASAAKPALLSEVPSGPGEGQYLLPATNTARSVDLDLIQNIMRLPYRQRFTIFLNEFGTAFAGNGAELQRALKKSDPALRQFDNVLRILAEQNRDARDPRGQRRQGARPARARAPPHPRLHQLVGRPPPRRPARRRARRWRRTSACCRSSCASWCRR